MKLINTAAEFCFNPQYRSIWSYSEAMYSFDMQAQGIVLWFQKINNVAT